MVVIVPPPSLPREVPRRGILPDRATERGHLEGPKDAMFVPNARGSGGTTPISFS
jgi:hypothetical protein